MTSVAEHDSDDPENSAKQPLLPKAATDVERKGVAGEIADLLRLAGPIFVGMSAWVIMKVSGCCCGCSLVSV